MPIHPVASMSIGAGLGLGLTGVGTGIKWSTYKEKTKNPTFKDFFKKNKAHIIGSAAINSTLGASLFIPSSSTRYRANYKYERAYTNNYSRPTTSFSDHMKDIGGVNIKTKADAKRAYIDAAKKYHPDINKDPNATKKMQKINDAWKKHKSIRSLASLLFYLIITLKL